MNFILRPWERRDLGSLVKYANNLNIAKFMTNQFPHPYTIEDGKAFIETAATGKPVNIMAIEVNNEAAGGIGIHLQPDIYCMNAEMGYWLAEPFWGKGIITKAIIQMKDYAFSNWKLERIYARPFGTNKASQRVLEKAGFTREALFLKTIYKYGENHDEQVFGIRKLSKQ